MTDSWKYIYIGKIKLCRYVKKTSPLTGLDYNEFTLDDDEIHTCFEDLFVTDSSDKAESLLKKYSCKEYIRDYFKITKEATKTPFDTNKKYVMFTAVEYYTPDNGESMAATEGGGATLIFETAL